MKSDKNSLIGFVLLGILFFSYFWYTNQQQTALVAFKKQQEDSIAKVESLSTAKEAHQAFAQDFVYIVYKEGNEFAHKAFAKDLRLLGAKHPSLKWNKRFLPTKNGTVRETEIQPITNLL